MQAGIEIIILPYSGQKDRTLLQVLIDQFNNATWTHFRCAVAFLKQSGIYQELLDSLRNFMSRGGIVHMTFGANVFDNDVKGTDYTATELILKTVQSDPHSQVFLYHEKQRTFHPKLYLFSNEKIQQALLVIGSSNWSKGGLINNVEANIIVKLDLSQDNHLSVYNDICECFSDYWQEKA